jgi:hypothetical protein
VNTLVKFQQAPKWPLKYWLRASLRIPWR